MSVTKSTTGQNSTEHFGKILRSENLIQFKIVAITMQCNDQETVYIFTIPPLFYIYFYLLLKRQ